MNVDRLIASLDATSIRCMLTLMHFVWQGLVIGGFAAAATVLLQQKSARALYSLLVVALAAMAACPVMTFCLLEGSAPSPVTEPPQGATGDAEGPRAAQPVVAAATHSATATHPDGPQGEKPDELHRPTVASPQSGMLSAGAPPVGSLPGVLLERNWLRYAPLLTSAYLAGVAFLLARLLFGLYGGRRLRNQSELVADPSLLALLRRHSGSLGLRCAPPLAYCRRVAVPTVVGILRPVILLPLYVASGLTEHELGVILTHELAHIRRYDHLVNLFQRFAEAFLFFHPAVWWVSRQIRLQREHCCDDVVVALGTQPLVYVRSLLRVAELSRPLPRPAESVAGLCAVNRASALRLRIARLLGSANEPQVRLVRVWPLALVPLLGAALALSALAHPSATNAAPPADPPAAASEWGLPDNGLVCRIVCVDPQTDEQHPDMAKAARTNRFARVEDITLLAELKNVGDKRQSVQGVRYGDTVTLPWPGKSSSAEFAPSLFTYEFFDRAGKPIERPLRSTNDTDAMLRLSGGTVEAIAPGESLVMLVRPADGDTGLASRLADGDYQVRVRYHGPLLGVRKEMQRVWPDKPVTRAWSGDAASPLVPLSLANPHPAAEMAWGKAKDGLRAAVEFRPIVPAGAAANAADYSIPEGGRADVRVHLQNVSAKDISLWSETWRQDDTVYRVDAAGKETQLGHAWYSGWPTMEHWTLKPGQSAVIAAINLGTAADANSAAKFEHPVGPMIIGPPGTYRLRYDIHLGRLQSSSPDGKTKIPGPGDWQGTLSTGLASITVRPRRPSDEPATFIARLRLQGPDGKPVTAGHVVVRMQSGYQQLLKADLGPQPVEVPKCRLEPLVVSVRAAGFEETRFYDVAAKPGEITTLTLRPAQPTRFRLITRDGKPVAGAKVRYFVRSKADASSGPYPSDGLHGPVWATSDARGEVLLDTLEKFDPQDRKLGNNIYFFYIESPGLAPRFLGPLQAGENLGDLTVGPLLEVRGEVRGTPAELGEFTAEWDQPEEIRRGDGKDGWQYAESKNLQTERHGDRLTFHLSGLRPGKLRIVSRFKRGGKSESHVYSRREPNEDDVVFAVDLTDSRQDLVITNQPAAKKTP
jgi:hypothetical protein